MGGGGEIVLQGVLQASPSQWAAPCKEREGLGNLSHFFWQIGLSNSSVNVP